MLATACWQLIVTDSSQSLPDRLRACRYGVDKARNTAYNLKGAREPLSPAPRSVPNTSETTHLEMSTQDIEHHPVNNIETQHIRM